MATLPGSSSPSFELLPLRKIYAHPCLAKLVSGQALHLRFSLPFAASILAIVGIFYGVAQFNHIPTVSAQEILRRASEEGTRHISQVAKPVVHRKVRVARRATGSRAETLTWETWNDPENHRFAQRVTDGDRDSSRCARWQRTGHRSAIGRTAVRVSTRMVMMRGILFLGEPRTVA